MVSEKNPDDFTLDDWRNMFNALTDLHTAAVERAEKAKNLALEYQYALVAAEFDLAQFQDDLIGLLNIVPPDDDEWDATEPIVHEVAALRAQLDEATAWRPVTEPPDEEGVYLVARRPNDPPHTWLIDIVPYLNNPHKSIRLYEKATQWPCYESTFCPVTHWRPLPALPEPEQEQEQAQ